MTEFKIGDNVTLVDQNQFGQGKAGWAGPMVVTDITDKFGTISCKHPARGLGAFMNKDLKLVKVSNMKFNIGDEVELLENDSRKTKYGKLIVKEFIGSYVSCFSENLGYRVSFFPETIKLKPAAEMFRIFVGPVLSVALKPYSNQNFDSQKDAEDFIMRTVAKDQYAELVIVKVVKTLKKTQKKTEKVVVETTEVWE